MTLISDAFEDISQALRVLLDADAKANRFGLIHYDFAKAVGIDWPVKYNKIIRDENGIFT